MSALPRVTIPPPTDDTPTPAPTALPTVAPTAAAHVCPSCTTTHPPAPVPLFVNVQVDPSSIVHHMVPEDMVELIGAEFTHIKLLDAPYITVPHGTHVTHGDNSYIVVEHFVTEEEKKTLPETNNRIRKEIPAGTLIIDSTGLPVTIAAPIMVDILGASKIRLSAGTRLQQVDGNIKLKLEGETVVRLD